VTSTKPIVGAVVIDFDGTIVEQDVSEQILEAFAPPEWWDIDLEFQRGEIGSRECLVRQARLLDGRQDDMLAFALDTYEVDPTFPPFVTWAQESRIRVAVASDGFGFYVEPMLRMAGVEGVKVFRNDVAVDERPMGFAFPFAHPVCVGCGTCKMEIVRLHRREVGSVAFVGEGHTDRYGALYSDLVFAKKALVEICRADGVPFLHWETFDDVQAALATLDRLPGAVDPSRCPGWTEPPAFSS
jgi:2-hydroxy-3-keto-5-methylthiopentenyl-1-phosphate phosphatase